MVPQRTKRENPISSCSRPTDYCGGGGQRSGQNILVPAACGPLLHCGRCTLFQGGHLVFLSRQLGAQLSPADPGKFPSQWFLLAMEIPSALLYAFQGKLCGAVRVGGRVGCWGKLREQNGEWKCMENKRPGQIRQCLRHSVHVSPQCINKMDCSGSNISARVNMKNLPGLKARPRALSAVK